MEKLKTYMKQDSKGLICSAITVVGALLGLVMYIITTGNTNGEVSTSCNNFCGCSGTGSMLLLPALCRGNLIGSFRIPVLIQYADVYLFTGRQYWVCGSRNLRYRIWNTGYADRWCGMLPCSSDLRKHQCIL